MAQQFLNNAQVSASFQKVRGVAVSQGMRVQSLDAGIAPVLLHQRMHGLARDATAPRVEEDRRRRRAPLNQHRPRLVQISLKYALGAAQHGHHTLLRALAKHAQHLLIQIEVAQVKVAQLRHAKAAAVERLKNGLVARERRFRQLAAALGRVAVPLKEVLVQQAKHLLARDDVRQALGLLG